MVKGQCNCGAVAFEFEVSADLAGVVVCHCSICRRATGANGMAVLLADNDAFRWLSGEELVRRWKKPGADWECWFCPTCGSPVPGTNDPARMFIPAGTISEGGKSLEVIHHIFVDSRASWDEICDSGKQHREAFTG